MRLPTRQDRVSPRRLVSRQNLLYLRINQLHDPGATKKKKFPKISLNIKDLFKSL
jgi:hypothetical protein